jgi:biopolymer transport protein TolR
MGRFQAGREKKIEKLNFEVNLVPFIDLLSSLVMFLLVTAVWIQISVVPASVQVKETSIANASTPPSTRTLIKLTPTAYELTWPPTYSNLPRSLLKKDGDYDVAALVELLSQANKSSITEAAITADEEVSYGSVVQAIDAAKSGGFAVVALSIPAHPS